jgi:hypothetical protein
VIIQQELALGAGFLPSIKHAGNVELISPVTRGLPQLA